MYLSKTKLAGFIKFHTLLFLAPFLFVLQLETLFAQDNRPNILVILCDDLGYGDIASYGHPHIQTPNLDKMAREGVRFTDFYSTAPVCSPSRVGLLTGRSPNRAGVYDWIPPAAEPKPDARDQVHLQAHEITIPMLMKKAGYATAMAGKWHCNAKFNSSQQPQPGDAGFDHWMATHNNAFPSHHNPSNFVRNGVSLGELEGYSCQIVADEGIKWIKNHNSKESQQPFFLYLAFHEPHEPVASPQVLVDKYKDVATTTKEATYFANVENVDIAIGKILDALKSLSLDDNTLVIFTSDNGPETLSRYEGASYSYGRPTPLRGMKLWTTDAGFRVAAIMRWPEGIKGGQTISQPVSALDFLPTFCQLARVETPSNHVLDGTSFLPALKNKKIKRNKPLIWAYYRAINEHHVAMRDGKWKVLAKLNIERKYFNLNDQNIAEVKAARFVDFEVYKITDDISESQNLLIGKPKKKARLRKKLEDNYRRLLNDSYIWKVED
ncbi:MAG: arylsulfatase A [Saprospiraceae bacterium]|jgi:arylsulfatase A